MKRAIGRFLATLLQSALRVLDAIVTVVVAGVVVHALACGAAVVSAAVTGAGDADACAF